MEVIKGSKFYYFDCDDTLVMWNKGPFVVDAPEVGSIPINLKVKEIEQTFHVKPHFEHINLLKRKKIGGSTIIVWSRAGWEWAEAVVNHLKIDGYVDLVISKPDTYVDDKKCSEWMNDNCYIPYNGPSIKDPVGDLVGS